MGSLTQDLVFPLGDDDFLAFDAPITDHIAAAVDRLAYQFKQSGNLNQLVTELCNQVNDLQIAIGEQMPFLPVIAQSFGAQLDVIGVLVGEPRGGFNDADYRVHLTAKIFLNRSSGRADDIYKLFSALLGISAGLRIEEHPPAAFTLHVTSVTLDDTLAGYLSNLLQKARGAGINGMLNWSLFPHSQTFSFDGGSAVGFENGFWSTTE